MHGVFLVVGSRDRCLGVGFGFAFAAWHGMAWQEWQEW